MVEKTEFREAMSLLSSAVSVVTTQGDTGRFGFTASAICSVTDSPPTLLVCMNSSASSHGHFVDNQILAVNVLGSHQQAIAQAFSSPMTSHERFAQGDWIKLDTGSPILTNALVSFDCQIEQMQTVGTHTIFICRVVAIHQNDHRTSLVYFKRSYYEINATDS